MSGFIDRVLAAYRPMYLRGLLLDGQYRLPSPQEMKAAKGDRVVEVTPAFDPGRKRVLIVPTASRLNPADEPSGDLHGA